MGLQELYYLAVIQPSLFYESPGTSKCDPEFYHLVTATYPGFDIKQSGIFAYATPGRVAPLIDQGWKIHCSATSADAKRLLARVAEVCGQSSTSFKFISDLRLLAHVNSRAWPRSASGKFITIYPSDPLSTRHLLQELHEVTSDLRGPYILSDRRYAGSHVLFYRYGGHRLDAHTRPDGSIEAVVRNPDGTDRTDERVPHWRKPPGVPDLFPTAPPAPSRSHQTPRTPTLLNDRYLITAAISFSAAGGTYRALDRQNNDKNVIICEGRPYIHTDQRGRDAASRLQDEHDILRRISKNHIAPTPVDIFTAWEHRFLVEDELPGESAARFFLPLNPLLRPNAGPREYSTFARRFSQFTTALLEVFACMEREGLAYTDVSPRNILVQRDDETDELSIKLIDFDSVAPIDTIDDSDITWMMQTPGFRRSTRQGCARRAIDPRQVGLLLASILFPVTQLAEISTNLLNRPISLASSELGLSPELGELVIELVEDRHASITMDDLSRRFQAVLPANPTLTTDTTDNNVGSGGRGRRVTGDQVLELAESLAHGILQASRSSDDKAFPGAAMSLSSNPWSFAYGDAGVLYSLSVTGDYKLDSYADRLEQGITSTRMPSGLHTGLAGIAWTLGDLGRRQAAGRVLRTCAYSTTATSSIDLSLSTGLAGNGLAELHHVLMHPEDEDVLAIANAHFADIVASSSSIQELDAGYASGPSGIGTFCIYYAAVFDDSMAAELARRCIHHDIEQIRIDDRGVASIESTGPNGHLAVTPYWNCGSAGVASTICRYLTHIDPDDRVLIAALETLGTDLVRRFAVYPGYFGGLAGVGDSLLDLYTLTGHTRWINAAASMVPTLECFMVPYRHGSLVPLTGYSGYLATSRQAPLAS